jgi:hypothetical protein
MNVDEKLLIALESFQKNAAFHKGSGDSEAITTKLHPFAFV